MKVVLDTNTVISGLLSKTGAPRTVIDLWIQERLTIVVSPDLAAEYIGVLLRDKFKVLGSIEERKALMFGFLELPNCLFVHPDVKIKAVTEDPDDNMVLECAVAGMVDYIISGDVHLLGLKEYQGIKIVNASQFLEWWT